MNIVNKKRNTTCTQCPGLRDRKGFTWVVKFRIVVTQLKDFMMKRFGNAKKIREKKLRIFNPMRNSTTGFTLIETLVAISILLFAISAPLTIASRGLASSFFARDQITAFYLTQDAVEYIRNTRDNNFLSNVDWLNEFPSTNGLPFIVDTINGIMTLCPQEGCVALDYNDSTGFYSHDDPGGNFSIFTRSVLIQTINANEVIISVTISWSVGTFSRTFSVNENILNWQ